MSLHACAEESPDREGQLAGESPGRSNLTVAVTENNRLRVRVKTRGKSSRRSVETQSGYGPKSCKTKYTDS